jgi:hypothetical protein
MTTEHLIAAAAVLAAIAVVAALVGPPVVRRWVSGVGTASSAT